MPDKLSCLKYKAKFSGIACPAFGDERFYNKIEVIRNIGNKIIPKIRPT